MRWLRWFILGLVASVAFWQQFAPRPEYTPDKAALSQAPTDVCGRFGHPVRAVRTDHFTTFSLYDVWCSDSSVPTTAAW
jgi:hypothetical protein